MRLRLPGIFSKRRIAEPDRFALHSGERQTALHIDGVRHDHIARYRYASELLTERLADLSAAFGLDAFCGTGYGTHLLAQHAGCPVLGIDASDEAIGVANVHFANDRSFFSAKKFPFSLPRNAFDFVVSLESVEHVAETNRFIDVIVGALKPGGVLILSTPNASTWSLAANPNPFHHRHFTRAELIALLVESRTPGLNLIDWQGQDIYEFRDGCIMRPLDAGAMGLVPQMEGQILIFAFQKPA